MSQFALPASLVEELLARNVAGTLRRPHDSRLRARLYKVSETNQDGEWMRLGTWITTLAWLVTVATRTMAEGPAAGVNTWPLEVPKGGSPGFTLMSGNQTGIQFTNVLLSWPEATNQNLLNGAGLALGDYDGDGWDDFFVTDMVSRFHGLSNPTCKLPLSLFFRVT